MVPFRQFVLKTHSRCDLACDHCYVYRHADQGWRSQPTVMTQETVSRAAERIAEHARAHRLCEVHVVLHGGEPLLAGPDRLERTASILRKTIGQVCGLDLRIHTNGVLLDKAFCEAFARQQIMVGVSLDGDQRANDLHRRYADGRSSYDRVITAIELLRSPPYRHLYAGILCTIDIRNDPISVYEALIALKPPSVDFLLPHATWQHPPFRATASESEYAGWLIPIYERWTRQGRPVRIRTFDSVIRTTCGLGSLTEALGLEHCDLIVVETDGSYEQADSLKTAFDGAPATGCDVYHHDLDAAARHPGFAARQRGLEGLCEACQGCPVVTSCGGGLYAHRYDPAGGFDNPSVYCADLMKLISHIRNRLRDTVYPVEVKASTHAVPLASFDTLAAGYGGAEALHELIAAQTSVRRALLAAVYHAIHDNIRAQGNTSALDASWEILLQAESRAASTLDEVLAHPYFRLWAVRCLQDLRQPAHGPRRGTSLAPQWLDYLASIAIVAALRADVHTRLEMFTKRGMLYMPSLGRFVVGQEPSAGKVLIETVGNGRFVIQAGPNHWPVDIHVPPERPSHRWQPVRKLQTDAMVVVLEDTDPYRDCHQWPATRRLNDKQVEAWQSMFCDAWALIKQDYGKYAPALANGLTTLTPLTKPARGRAISATARHAFGAIAAALPADPIALALLLLHEFQHLKLGGVLDMYDLYDQADTRLFQAPWRNDLRPLEGLFQGTYAHISVTDFWRVRRDVDTGGKAAMADQQFQHWHPRTATAIETLATSGSLTELGHRFVAGMRDSVASWKESRAPGKPLPGQPRASSAPLHAP